MKNKIKLLGIIAVIAVIGFSMAACDNGWGGDESLNGTWTGSGGTLTLNSGDFELTASGGTYKIKGTYDADNGSGSGKGTQVSSDGGSTWLSKDEVPAGYASYFEPFTFTYDATTLTTSIFGPFTRS